jgi:uncharacterized protein YkwD
MFNKSPRTSFKPVLIFGLLMHASAFSGAQPDEVLKIINEVRTDPQEFLKARLMPYIKEKGMADNSYAKSLVEDLKTAKKVNPLESSALLTRLARGHALDMGGHGKVGHESSNGTTFVNRLRKKVKTGMIAENCDYGNSDPLDIVMSLLIDDGVASLGHRKNILHPQLKYVGIAIEKHKTYRMNCVMDFAESSY